METAFSLNNILTYLHSLSLSASNKKWLGERLIEEAKGATEGKTQSYDDFIDSMCGAWKNDPRTAEEISREIRNARQFGQTRHIMPLTND